MGFPRRLDEILAEVMLHRGYGAELTAVDREQAWKEVVGPPFAAMTCPTRLRDGVLEILVQNSTVVQELTFQKPELLRCLMERLPDQQIRDLRFRIGNV